MQSADFLSAVFFYLKEGENLNQNWIVENLNNAFSTWNGKLGELWGLVTTGPQTFKGGAVWSVMQTLHNGMVGIGYALVVLFFAISLCKNTMNFHELKRPEAAIHYFLRFVAAKALVGYGMDIMLNVFSICNGIVTDMADSMGGISEAMVSLPAEMQTAIENVGFLASIPLWLVTILGSLFITVLSFVMILTVYGRFFRLYMYTALAPLPLAAFAGESTQSVGISFLKSYVAVCLEGAVIVLACVIYSAFVSTPTVTSGEATTIVWSYLAETVFNMLVLVGLIKGSPIVSAPLFSNNSSHSCGKSRSSSTISTVSSHIGMLTVTSSPGCWLKQSKMGKQPACPAASASVFASKLIISSCVIKSSEADKIPQKLRLHTE